MSDGVLGGFNVELSQQSNRIIRSNRPQQDVLLLYLPWVLRSFLNLRSPNIRSDFWTLSRLMS